MRSIERKIKTKSKKRQITLKAASMNICHIIPNVCIYWSDYGYIKDRYIAIEIGWFIFACGVLLEKKSDK